METRGEWCGGGNKADYSAEMDFSLGKSEWRTGVLILSLMSNGDQVSEVLCHTPAERHTHTDKGEETQGKTDSVK